MTMLENRVALVTGTSGTGIGHGAALALAAQGATVIATARRIEAAQEVVAEIEAEGGKALAVALDTANSQSCDAAIEAAVTRFGRLDILVHSATHGASSSPELFTDIAEQGWRDMSAVSLSGSFYLARAALPHLKQGGEGRLILFTSLRGVAGLDPNPAYAVQKAAVRGMTRALSREWGPHGITVNAIAPASMSKPSMNYFSANPGLLESLQEKIPLRRIGDPRHDIGAAIAMLAGPGGRYLTGQTIVLDGGLFTAT